ncbi:MAG TPA: cytochrome C [Cytophagales bacterium]|nr:cytochrome C [Cytophagales bacterium]HAA18304.1 cytochrome C [Cytophagales bacterium]HAP63877.1 cytochrome C [Cytophagales bacterium]
MKRPLGILCLAALLAACGSNQKPVDDVQVADPAGAENAANAERNKNRQRQYFVQGKNLYATYCQNCHQPDGSGLGALYPPLKDSDYLPNHQAEVACGIKHGMMGPLMVNGTEYNQVMVGQTNLTNLEIAEIMTYVYTEFGDQEVLIDVKTVDKYMADCTGMVNFNKE